MNRNNYFTVRCNKNKPKCVITDYSKDTVKDDRKCKDCLSKEDIIRIIRRIVQNLPEGPPGPEGPEGPQGPGGSDGDSGEIEFVESGDEIDTDEYPDGSLFIITEVTENRVKKNKHKYGKNRPKSKDIVIISGNPYDVFQLDGNVLIEKGNIKGDSGESAEFIFINQDNAPDNLDGYDSNTLFIVTEQIPDDPQKPFGGREPYEMFTIQAGNLVEAGNIQGPQGDPGEAGTSVIGIDKLDDWTDLDPNDYPVGTTFVYLGEPDSSDPNNTLPGDTRLVVQGTGDEHELEETESIRGPQGEEGEPGSDGISMIGINDPTVWDQLQGNTNPNDYPVGTTVVYLGSEGDDAIPGDTKLLTGNPPEWEETESIRGPQGEPGSDGNDGDEGPQGPPGLSVVPTFEAWESMLDVVNNNTELEPPLTFLYTGEEGDGATVDNPFPGQVWQWDGGENWVLVHDPPLSNLVISNFSATTTNIQGVNELTIEFPMVDDDGDVDPVEIPIIQGESIDIQGSIYINTSIPGFPLNGLWSGGSLMINQFQGTPYDPEYPIEITIIGEFSDGSSNTHIQWEITGEITDNPSNPFNATTNQISGEIGGISIGEEEFDSININSTIQPLGFLAKSKGIKSFRSKKTGHKARKIGLKDELFGKSRVLENKSLSNVKYHVVHPHPDNGKERLSGNAHEDNEYSLSNEYDRQGNVLGVKVSSKYSNGLFPNARFILDVLPKGTDLENIEKLTLTLNSEHTEDLAGIAFHLYLNKYPQFGGNITPWVITPVKEELSAEGDVRYNLIDSKWRIVDQSETYTYSEIISNYKREDAVSKLFNLSSDMNYEVAHLNEIVIGAYGSSDNIKEGQVLNVLVKEISYKLFGKDERRIIPYIPGEEMFEGLKNPKE